MPKTSSAGHDLDRTNRANWGKRLQELPPFGESDPSDAAALFSSIEVKLDKVVADSPGLGFQLPEFEIGVTAACIGGLLTLPDLQANQLRLEVLAHLAAAYCAGRRKPRRKQFARWLNRSLKDISVLEDPREDVFVSNLVSPLGNHRVFEGLWESADFWTQQILQILIRFPKALDAARLWSNIGPLLKLSEEIASRSRLARFEEGGGIAKLDLPIPDDESLGRAAETVVFEFSDLDRLGIDIPSLEPFVFPDNRSVTRHERLGQSTLERRPLLRVGDRIIVALPTALTVAIRRYVLDECHRLGLMTVLSSGLETQQRAVLKGAFFTRLGATPIDARTFGPDFDRPDEFICAFDVGHYAHVLLVPDDLSRAQAEAYASPYKMPLRDESVFRERIRNVAELISHRSDYQAGLTIVIFGGIGRGFVAEADELPNAWHFAHFSLADLWLLARSHDISLHRLWKMENQVELLRKEQFVPATLNGDLNLYAHWREHGWTFVPNRVPVHLVMRIPTDSLAGLRAEVRRNCNIHVASLPSGKQVIVERFRTSAWFRSLKGLPLYVSEQLLSQGELAGCIETTNRVWWIRVDGASRLVDRGFAYHLWEATADWMLRIAPEIEKAIPLSRAATKENLVVELDLHELDQAAPRTLDFVNHLTAQLPTADVLYGGKVRVHLPGGFLSVLAEPTNRGEKTLCRAITLGVVARLQSPWSATFETILDDIFSDPGARFIHIVASGDFRETSRVFHKWEQYRIPPEDREWSQLGLAWLCDVSRTPARIEGARDCVSYLNHLVDQVWGRIRERLRQIERLSLVRRCIERIDATAVDGKRWHLSSRAHLALYGSREEVLTVAREQEIGRAQTAIAARTTIEMGVCECPDSGRQLSDCELDTIFADVEQLFALASQSDAIHHGFARAFVNISESGRLSSDEGFYSTVVEPYSFELYDSGFHENVGSYEKLTKANEGIQPGADYVLAREFEDAFICEYGISPQAAVQVLSAIEEQAFECKEIVIHRNREDLTRLLVEKTDQPKQALAHFLSAMILPRRPAWDESRPEGFHARDWMPWRFRRRLSVVSRPIIEIDEETVAYSPGLLGDSLEYLMNSGVSGDLPPNFYFGAKMQAWAGTAVRRRGEEFNDRVLKQVISAGLYAKARILMSELGVPVDSKSLRQSDVDVLAWSMTTGLVLVIECKRLLLAKTVGEIADQLNDFRSGGSGTGKNNLQRHLERFRWLDSNRAGLERLTGIAVQRMHLVQLIVTNTIVPMQFASRTPEMEIVRIDDLERWIQTENRRILTGRA